MEYDWPEAEGPWSPWPLEPSSLPEGIGPHEGMELRLMLAGIKPAAMFSDTLPVSDHPMPEYDFDHYVASGNFVKNEVTFPMLVQTAHPDITHIRYIFYAIAREAWRVDALERVQIELHNYIKAHPYDKKISDFEPMDIEIGRLLGYTEDQIDTFLKHQRRHITDPESDTLLE